MGYKLRLFELTYPGGRKITVKAKSRRTLDRRMSKGERQDCLVREVR